MDIAVDSLMQARARIDSVEVEFVGADATRLPFRDGAFTKAVVLEILEHLPEANQRMLAHEVDRVLKENARLAISSVERAHHLYKVCSLWESYTIMGTSSFYG